MKSLPLSFKRLKPAEEGHRTAYTIHATEALDRDLVG